MTPKEIEKFGKTLSTIHKIPMPKINEDLCEAATKEIFNIMKPIFHNECVFKDCNNCIFYQEGFYIDKTDMGKPFLVENFNCERYNNKIVIKNVRS